MVPFAAGHSGPIGDGEAEEDETADELDGCVEVVPTDMAVEYGAGMPTDDVESEVVLHVEEDVEEMPAVEEVDIDDAEVEDDAEAPAAEVDVDKAAAGDEDEVAPLPALITAT